MQEFEKSVLRAMAKNPDHLEVVRGGSPVLVAEVIATQFGKARMSRSTLQDMCYRRSGKRRKGLTRRTTAFPSFVWDRSASRRVRRLRPKTRLAGAGEALSYPTRRPWAGDDP